MRVFFHFETLYLRYGKFIALLTLLCIPFLLYGANRAWDSTGNDVLDWLPGSFEETDRLAWFAKRFGSDEILVVSWPDCTVEDERLDQLADALTKPEKISTGNILFRYVFTGRQMLKDLMASPLNLGRQEAVGRLQKWLVGVDEKSTCAVALVSNAGMADRNAAVEMVYQIAPSCGLTPEEIRVGGSTVDSVAIDRASQQRMDLMIFLSAFVSLGMSWLCLRSVRLVASVFVVAIFSWAAILTVVYLSPVHMDAVLLMMPALVFVLTISGGVHLTNYYLDASAEQETQNSLSTAMRHGWLPCLLASVTTAVGLGSLAVSRVVPVGRFGLFAAAGVLIGLGSLLILWPSTITWWGPSSRMGMTGSGDRAGGHRTVHPWWQGCFLLATTRPLLLLLMAAVALPFLVMGVAKINTSVKLEDLFQKNSQWIQNYTWLESHIGPLVPMEVVLRYGVGDGGNSESLIKRAMLVEALRRKIGSLPFVSGAVAATTFAPSLPRGRGVRQVVQRRLFARELEDRLQEFVDLRYLSNDDDEQLWRISTRASALEKINYGDLMAALSREVNNFLDKQRSDNDLYPTAEIFGAIPLIYKAQQQLLRDLVKSFFTAFVLIAVAMSVLMRSLMAGLLSMVPNVFPALCVFGTMGLMGVAVDIGAMMTASAALGIAVDDTTHYVIWFRRGVSCCATRREAIYFAYQRSATAMLQTSIICGLGLLVFVISPFKPTARFGWLMATLLFTALVGDLLLLPALLASRLGGFLVPKKLSKPHPNQKQTDSRLQHTDLG